MSDSGITVCNLVKVFAGHHSTITEYGDGTALVTTASRGLTKAQLHELVDAIDRYLELVPEPETGEKGGAT